MSPAGVQGEGRTSSTVLFLAANPAEVQALQLGEECRAIEDQIRAARFRDQIGFRSRWAARPDDLLQALNEDTPSVLHFSGHGTGDQGLCFQAEDGSAERVSADGLSQVMRAAGAEVALVVLNACYSEVQAQALVAHVPCVIGMPDAIGDEAAIVYAASLYRALAFGKSVANAHQQGLAALALHATGGPPRDVRPTGHAGADAPQVPAPTLLSRPDIDADSVYIVHRGAKTTSGLHGRRVRKSIAVLVLLAVAVAVAVTVTAKVMIDKSRTRGAFDVVVRLHGPASLFDVVCTSGTVTLDIGIDRRKKQITREGEAYFAEIPRSLAKKPVPIDVACDGYEIDAKPASITLAPDQTLYAKLRPLCGNHRCDPREMHQSCPGDCPELTVDAGVDAGGTPPPGSVPPPVDGGHDAAREHPRNGPAQTQGPCTRTPGGILHAASASCPKLKPTEPDARAIAREEKEKGYTCTEFYRCK